MYLVLAIYNFNEPKNIYLQYLNKQYKENGVLPNLEKINAIKYKYDVEFGYHISKNVLSKIINEKDLYIVKNILIKYDIIGNIPLFKNSMVTSTSLHDLLLNR